jgi:hypothetical protein
MKDLSSMHEVLVLILIGSIVTKKKNCENLLLPSTRWILPLYSVATLEILENLGKILKGNLSTQLPNTVIFKPYFQYLILERIFKQETTRKKGTALFHKTRITHNLVWIKLIGHIRWWFFYFGFRLHNTHILNTCSRNEKPPRLWN